MMPTRLSTARLVAAAVIACAAPAHPQATAEHAPGHAPAGSAAAGAALVDGEVRKVDREQAKLTLRHGPIPNLDMTPMTMVFRVAEPKLLEGLKEGDKVKFTADRINGAYTVMSIEPVR